MLIRKESQLIVPPRCVHTHVINTFASAPMPIRSPQQQGAMVTRHQHRHKHARTLTHTHAHMRAEANLCE
eukprot:5531758-Amphidinium_carterae.1